jgi:hypothetical protein
MIVCELSLYLGRISDVVGRESFIPSLSSKLNRWTSFSLSLPVDLCLVLTIAYVSFVSWAAFCAIAAERPFEKSPAITAKPGQL